MKAQLIVGLAVVGVVATASAAMAINASALTTLSNDSMSRAAEVLVPTDNSTTLPASKTAATTPTATPTAEPAPKSSAPTNSAPTNSVPTNSAPTNSAPTHPLTRGDDADADDGAEANDD